MKRAVDLFAIDRRVPRSAFAEETWWTRSADVGAFVSVAATHWEFVVTRQSGTAHLTVRGPETKATTVPVPEDAEFLGIQFALGTFMPALPPAQLVDRALTLPQATSSSFLLDGSAWELPSRDNVDVFVDRLVRAGLLVHDPIVSAAVHGDVDGLSTRTLERRVLRTTGLTRGTFRQIRRAERAVEMLSRGVSPVHVASLAGYTDQPHLSKSLRRFVGLTPAEIVASSCRPDPTS
jgi:hypothetical protein